MAEEVQETPSAGWVQALVDEAKAKALFQDLPAGREKGEVI